jgi:hypothetical protein
MPLLYLLVACLAGLLCLSRPAAGAPLPVRLPPLPPLPKPPTAPSPRAEKTHEQLLCVVSPQILTYNYCAPRIAGRCAYARACVRARGARAFYARVWVRGGLGVRKEQHTCCKSASYLTIIPYNSPVCRVFLQARGSQPPKSRHKIGG